MLLGVVAVEMGFISRDDLVDALDARGRERAKTLGEVLVERRLLGGEEYALLQAVVDRHVERHGNDPRRSLASFRTSLAGVEPRQAPDVNDRTRHAVDSGRDSDTPSEAGPRAVGTDSPSTQFAGPDDGFSPTPQPDAPPPPDGSGTDGPRFRILRHHASGGLGKVYVAFDRELNREVALKEIHAHFAHLADCRARFFLEAEVTGRLEHPGIVPVYGLGRYADGLPYYAMRLIKGRSLKDAIQTFHATRFADAGQRALALRNLLGAFLAVCQAIRYAHSRGIVHRDIKPENVMLGEFGETLVVDWGLAKTVNLPAGPGSLAGAGEGLVRPVSDAGPDTRMGAVLGTPGYMSPEQADGMMHEVGPASDVYSLGATLYTILTGKSPLPSVFGPSGAPGRGVGREIPPPRTVDRRVPPPLEAVCLKAMALLPQDRYPSVRELAGDVERWLADEPVTAYREPALTRLGRWGRKHPARVAGLTAAALVGAVGLLAGVLVVSDRNAELAAANRRETEARQQADARFREAQGAVNEFFIDISESKELLKKQPGTRALRKRLLEKARDYYEGFLRDRGDDPAVRAEAAAAYYRLAEITNSLDPGSPKAVEQYERGVAVLEPILRDRPGDPDALLLRAKLHTGLGRALSRADRFDDGLVYLEQARLDLESLVHDHPADADCAAALARTYGGIAYVQGLANRVKEALAANARAADIGERLVRDHPDVPDYAERLATTYLNMGADHKGAGDYEAALRSVSRALPVAERLVAKYPGVDQYLQLLVYCLNNAGHYQTVLGRRDDALATFARGLDSAERLDRENPGVPDYANILAYMYFNRGSLLLRQGEPDAARKSLARAREVGERVTRENPASHLYANQEAGVDCCLGWACHALGNDDEAAAAFARALAAWERLARENSKAPDAATGAAWLLADAPLPQYRDPKRAAELARQALSAEPDAPAALSAYGLALYRSGDAGAAVGVLDKACARMPEADGDRPRVDLALVLARWQAGQKDAARDLFARTTARLDKAGVRHPEYLALRAEATALLGAGGKPRGDGSP